MLRTFTFLLLFTIPSYSFSAEVFPAPFGLKWGMSESSLKKIGFTNADSNDHRLKILNSISAPKAWSKGERYTVVLYKNKLVKVLAASSDFENDVTGSVGIKAYQGIKSLLSNKYGSPKSLEHIGVKLYKDNDEFYQCLQYSGCGIYYSEFKYGGGTIVTNLEGLSRGTGYLKITYESPEFYIALKDMENKNKRSDANAL